MKLCNKCGVENKDSSKFCLNCGNKLEENCFVSFQEPKLADLEEKKIKMLRYIKRNGTFLLSYTHTTHTYQDISTENKANLLKFHNNITFDKFVFIEDTSFSGNCKEGLIFMTNGFYRHSGFHAGSLFIRYDDIIETCIDDKYLTITTKNDSYKFSYDFYLIDRFELILKLLIEINKQMPDSFDERNISGEKKGIFSKKNRQDVLERYTKINNIFEIKYKELAASFLSITLKWQNNYNKLGKELYSKDEILEKLLDVAKKFQNELLDLSPQIMKLRNETDDVNIIEGLNHMEKQILDTLKSSEG